MPPPLAGVPAVIEFFVILVLGLLVVAVIVAILVLPVVREHFYPSYKDTMLRDHIAFDYVLEDGATIKSTDGSLAQVIRISGVDLNALSVEIQEGLYQTRKAWIEGMAKFNVSFRVISTRTVREHLTDIEGFENKWLKKVQEVWHGTFRRSYRNCHYVVLSVGKGEERARNNLNDASIYTVDKMREFRPVLLKQGEAGDRSELLSFWAEMLNPCREVDIGSYSGRAIGSPVDGDLMFGSIDKRLADYLIFNEVTFLDVFGGVKNDGIACFRYGPDEVWMGAIGIGAWGSFSSAAILQAVMAADAELTVAHYVEVMDGAAALALLQQLMKRSVGAQMGRIQGVDNNVISQFSDAIALVESQASNRGMALCMHQMSIFVYGRSREELDTKIRLVIKTLDLFQIRAIRETSATEPLWFSMFPPHLEWVRGTRVMSANIAHFIEMSVPAQGLDNCEWGKKPAQIYRTAQGSPYGFTFHASSQPLALGNVAIFGAAGAGKTVAAAWNMVSMLGYKGARAFNFDRYEGLYVPTRVFGGLYLDTQTSHSEVGDVCMLNPLHMNLRPGSKDSKWLMNWLVNFVLDLGDTDRQSAEHIFHSLNQIASLPLDARNLDAIYEGIPGNVNARNLLKRWTTGESLGHLFNAPRDSLSFGDAPLITFDCTTVLDDPIATRALIPYLAYRIETEMQRTGAPWLMMFDETHALLQSGPTFKAWYLRLLQEIRKQRGAMVSCFQRVGTLREFGIEEAIRMLCPTHLILPNEQADQADYMDVLGLTQKEFNLVTKRDPSTRSMNRFMLLKREGEGSVVLDLDLTPLGKYLKLFYSGAKPAAILRTLEREENNLDRAITRYLGQ